MKSLEAWKGTKRQAHEGYFTGPTLRRSNNRKYTKK